METIISTHLEVFFEELECGEHRERGLVTRNVKSCVDKGNLDLPEV